uniref:Uncharacterized protein n=1 Tax=Octopus bimaculoides TaxID=37653 RepID=A0A0L8FR38_OCTBM
MNTPWSPLSNDIRIVTHTSPTTTITQSSIFWNYTAHYVSPFIDSEACYVVYRLHENNFSTFTRISCSNEPFLEYTAMNSPQHPFYSSS